MRLGCNFKYESCDESVVPRHNSERIPHVTVNIADCWQLTSSLLVKALIIKIYSGPLDGFTRRTSSRSTIT